MINLFFPKKISFTILCSFILLVPCHSQDQKNNDDDYDISLLFKESVQPSTALIPLHPSPSSENVDLSGLPFPQEIYSHLTRYTIGQYPAMKSLSTFIYKHLVHMRVQEFTLKNSYNSSIEGVDFSKPNILMMGPTGCGKTSSLALLAKYLKVPLAVGNATEWTAQGYIGQKWQGTFDKLCENAAAMLSLSGSLPSRQEILRQAEKGIVFIDEIDKLCGGGAGDLKVINRVQQELLPAIQGMELKLTNGEILHTKNILFIAGGAFPGLPSLDSKSSSFVTPQELEKYGMLPELVGRLGNIVQYNALDKQSLKRIIVKSKSSPLEHRTKLYKMVYQIDLTVTEEAIDYLAELAALQKTGARAINMIMDNLMQDIDFNIQQYIGKPLTITKEFAKEKLAKFEAPAKEEIDPSLAHLYT